ncbi:MAG: sigma-70 family RNA polymerase sigma factor [Bacteroidia bacterium]|nr:sigma-70 family RNA polymerase sigma factor [Bacteroidia bacterium]
MISTPPQDTIEEKIVQFLRERNPQAIRLIDQHYQLALFGVIFKIVGIQEMAEDVWQESLIKFWRFGNQYDPEKGRLFTWLLNICRRTSIDKIRSRDFREQKSGRQLEETNTKESTISKSLIEEPYVEGIGIKEMVDKLEPKYKDLIDLLYFRGHTQQEAAKELQIPLGTVKTRIRQGINLLRQWLRS